MSYYKRTADALLQDLLDAFGAVLIEGPKWCGKTTTASQLANSILRMQDASLRGEYLVTAKTKPSILLNGATPRLIDEWQDWMNASCDHRRCQCGSQRKASIYCQIREIQDLISDVYPKRQDSVDQSLF